MIKMSGVIIAFNEEKYIERCLQSLIGIVDEIVVVDSFSTDRTEEICRKYNVVFIKQKFLGYLEQKNFATSKASFDYIVSLDADEALSEELKKNILELKSTWIADGYYTNRLNNYCGKWLKYSWYPDTRVRLFKKDAGAWAGNNPHDFFELLPGKLKGKLKGDILHWAYDTYSEHYLKIDNFTSIAAKFYVLNVNKKIGLHKIIINPAWNFIKSYIIKRGFLDGFQGYVIAKFHASGTFLKYIKIRELQKQNKNG